ncbi:branched-chain alpha-keto acid dehydrogenase E2 component [Seinonella peptonophila]|uniref:Dihydrolipoamide acetyltransferase component of pyruvate dehydrogenase complex n=1 Tax=Seinonella peptonophila TaxID=112248 RepID=A0A1M4TKT2_9BACL|nr:dihydrolipoamide acetyltransferase family protein [Seinonella peptonophila]SHE45122.1 branched-chain alpha-keto acid dehydrogenase E2 component [Seinonella peptonophila]
MIIDLTMPQLGESVTEGMIARWLKRPGDVVKKYEPICEVATDKVNAEVPSTQSGILQEIIVAEGETVAVGHVICRLQIEQIEPEIANIDVVEEFETEELEEASPSMKKRYTPAVLRLAEENQIDLSRVRGTGMGGRITRKDVLRIVEGKKEIEPPVEHTDQQESEPIISVEKKTVSSQTEDEVIPLTPIRRTIAERMVKSKQEIPHAWVMMEADVTGLVAFRQRMKEEFREKEGISLTFMPFFIKAVVDSLKEFPQLNSVWQEDQIIHKKRINISMAISTERELFVPVIHDADEVSLLGLAKSVHRLKEKTFRGKLEVSDMQGGTFTVNNTGAFGSVASQPIINPPQAAILSFEAIVKRPIVIDQMIAIRDMMNLCLSIDHRIIDGWISGRFLQAVKQRLEAYGPDTKGIL